MNQPAHVLLALSGHGYGHLAQCAPVINALQVQLPSLRVTVCSSLPEAVIAGRLDKPFAYRAVELDVVLPMASAWEVDVQAARHAYSGFHKSIEAGQQSDINLLEETEPDLILANIPYRILSAAKHVGVPAVALCSLNWASIYAAYCDDDSQAILENMWDSYRSATVFLAPEPAIAMPELENYRAIGPIARCGVPQKPALIERLGLSPNTKLVMVALGGIATALPLENWPAVENVAWLFSETPVSARPDMFALNVLDMSFIDVLASVDVVLTKPGYGTYAEAVCNGTSLLTLERKDWPETRCLTEWAQQHGSLETISKSQFESGQFMRPLENLLNQSVPTARPAPDGILQAVERLLDYL